MDMEPPREARSVYVVRMKGAPEGGPGGGMHVVVVTPANDMYDHSMGDGGDIDDVWTQLMRHILGVPGCFVLVRTLNRRTARHIVTHLVRMLSWLAANLPDAYPIRIMQQNGCELRFRMGPRLVGPDATVAEQMDEVKREHYVMVKSTHERVRGIGLPTLCLRKQGAGHGLHVVNTTTYEELEREMFMSDEERERATV